MNKVNVPKLRFPGFDGEWENSVLNKFASLNPKNSSLPESFVYIDLESVTDGHLIKENIISKNEAPSRAQRILKEKDILYQTVRPYQKNNLYFNKVGQYVASTGYAQIRTKNDSKFLFHFLHTEKFVANVMLRCTGTSYPAINSTDLSNIEISFPTLPEQQKIASFLSAVDEKIQQLSRKKELLEQYKKGVMQQLFSDKLRFKDENGKDYPDWEEKKLGDVGKIVTGKTPSTNDSNLWDGEIQFITPTDIKEDIKYQENTARYVKSSDKIKILPINSIIYTCIASIGKMCISKYPSITNQQINSLIVNEFNNFEYVYYWLFYLTPYIKTTQANTTLPIINKTDFSKFHISIPSLPEQQKIANFLSSIDAKIENTKDELEKIQLFKKGLLQKMFV